MKALVVDGSYITRKMLSGVLWRAQITNVVHAADGDGAVAACEDQDFDIVFMDWNMPNMSGLQAVKTIREAGKTMPIIMVTTEAEKVRIDEALNAGANNYIVKPFDPDTIVEKISAVLSCL